MIRSNPDVQRVEISGIQIETGIEESIDFIRVDVHKSLITLSRRKSEFDALCPSFNRATSIENGTAVSTGWFIDIAHQTKSTGPTIESTSVR